TTAIAYGPSGRPSRLMMSDEEVTFAVFQRNAFSGCVGKPSADLNRLSNTCPVGSLIPFSCTTMLLPLFC
ncbi:MAG: hypothetical protein KBF97_01040, partial [Bacteroidetes bacterium]|nr:hypothetical protein [Bacteroidota bacterium]